MPRKSSIHFKPVANVRFAVSHSERTDLSEPAYLLPKEHQLNNVVVAGSLSENELAALFIQQKEGMSRQAKTAGASPFWEGVVVLADTDAKAQSANLQAWKVAYEKATGHKVLHISIHLDEGYMGTDGKPVYNPHAHAIVSRMDSKNRVIHLDRKQLAAVQDLTAETLKMQRGSTLAERGGKRGRAHIGHKEFRAQANEARLDLDGEKDKTAFEAKLTDSLSANLKHTKAQLKEVKAVAGKVPSLEAKVGQQAQQIADLAIKHTAEIAAVHEQNRIARQALKDSGEAKQIDYMALKKDTAASLEAQQKAHEAEVTELKKELAEALAEAAKVPGLDETISTQADEIERINTEYTELKADYGTLHTQSLEIQDARDKALASLATAEEKLATVLEAAGQQNAQLDAMTPTHPIPIPSPTPEKTLFVESPKPVEPVFPRLTEAEFKDLPKQKLSDRVVDAAKDVLVVCLGLAEAATKHQIFPASLIRAIEKMLTNYITPEPSPALEPPVPAPVVKSPSPAPKKGISR